MTTAAMRHASQSATCTVEYGAAQALRVPYRVYDISANSLTEAFIAAYAAVPAYGTFAGSGNVFANLVATKHSFTCVSDNEGVFVIDVDVEFIPYSELADRWVWQWDTSLQQKETNHDILGLPLYGQYTYPTSESEYGEYSFNPALAGQTVVAGASVTAEVVVAELSGRGIVESDTPQIYVDQWDQRVNSDPWGGFAAGVCRVARVVPKTYDYSTSPRRVMIDVTIQINAGGWNKTYGFKDPNTGEMPPDVVPGVGYKQAVLNNTMDFNKIWPAP